MRAHVLSGATVVALFTFVACGGAPEGSSRASGQADTTTTQGSDGTTWCHDWLQSTDGTQMYFDYQVAEQSFRPESYDVPTEQGVATTPWVNVTNDGFTGDEQVIVEVIHYDDPQLWSPHVTKAGAPETLALTWDTSQRKFTAPVKGGVLLWEKLNGSPTYAPTYKFAISVDGVWLTDPVSQSTAFGFDPRAQGKDGCDGVFPPTAGDAGVPSEAPVFAPPVAAQVYPGDALGFYVNAYDATGAPPVYAATGLPEGATFGTDQFQELVTWTPTASQAGDYALHVTASNSVGTSDVVLPVHVGPLFYPDMPLGDSVSQSVTKNVVLSYTNNQARSGLLATVTASVACTYAGSNPGRLIATCTLSIPSFSYSLAGPASSSIATVSAQTMTLTRGMQGNESTLLSGGVDQYRWQLTATLAAADPLYSITLDGSSNFGDSWTGYL